MQELELLKNTDTVNELLARYGVKFGIYKNNTFKEQLFPFDAIPRIIEKEEFDYLERGLKQREVHRMVPRVEKSGMNYDKNKLDLIKKLVEETEVDYYKIVNEVETMI